MTRVQLGNISMAKSVWVTSALIFGLVSFLSLPASATSIPLYTYHDGGPFIVDNDTGLTFELAKYLTSEAKGRWTFPVIALPRLRLNKTIQSAEKGIVPWVSPFWFKKLKLKNDLWTLPYLKDANVIVSHADNKIDYTGPESLFGFTVVSVLGAVKQTLEPYIKQGKIGQIHTPVFGGHIKMLAAKRGDFVSTSLTIAQYMVSKFNLDKKLYISSRPDDNYTRHFLVLNGHKDIQLFLNRTISKMATDPIWLAALEKFGAADLRVTQPEKPH